MWGSALVASSLALRIVAQVPGPAGPGVDSARAVVESLIGEHHLPGFAITVTRGNSVLWRQGFGLADREANLAATPTTRFRIGSVSKVVTATLLMRLVEEGRVSLDAPVGSYLALPPALAPLTLRQLSGHLGGVRHYGRGEFITTTRYPDLKTALEVFANDTLVAPPGTRYAYSSYGYTLIGAVLEAITGRSFGQLVDQYVANPLGLVSTAPDHDPAVVRARGYSVDSAGTTTGAVPDDLSGRVPAGGLLSSTDDLARIGLATLAPGLLTTASLEQMLTPQRIASGRSTGVGIGWRIGVDSAGRTYYHHGGTSNGGTAFLLVYPAERLVVAMASNAFTGWGQRQALAVAAAFLSPVPQPTRRAPPGGRSPA